MRMTQEIVRNRGCGRKVMEAMMNEDGRHEALTTTTLNLINVISSTINNASRYNHSLSLMIRFHTDEDSSLDI